MMVRDKLMGHWVCSVQTASSVERNIKLSRVILMRGVTLEKSIMKKRKVRDFHVPNLE